MPSLSFIATANAVWQCGATPVFADIDPRTYNLDPAAAERAITPRTKAIMPVHQVGLPADMDAFCALADRYGLAIVEDAACAIGADLQGPPDRLARPAGLLLAAPAQGHHHRRGRHDHACTTPSVAERLRQLRQHAMDVSDLARHSATGRRGRELSRARLQRPHDRHAGRARAAASSRSSTRSCERRRAWPSATTTRCARIPRPRDALRPALRPAHLAVLLRARRSAGSPIDRTELMRRAAAPTASPRAAA